MNIAILETGKPPAELIPSFGRYPEMLERLIGIEARTYEVEAGELPADAGAHDAYLITGSPAGVYDDLPWIPKLEAFLGLAKGRAKLVGICFGHQIMAQAFGGHVEKSSKGWAPASIPIRSFDASRGWTMPRSSLRRPRTRTRWCFSRLGPR